MYVSATRDNSSMYGRISAAPSAQLSPTASGRTCRTEFQNASGVWPDSVRPDASVIVPETMIGSRAPRRSNVCWIAKSAALAFSVSKTVSTSNRSAPPSINPSAASAYAETSSSYVTLRAPGSFTSGEIDAVRFVGPERAGDEPRPLGCPRGPAVGALARDPRGGFVDRAHLRFHPVVRLGNAGCAEGVRLDDVGARLEIGVVDRVHRLRLRHRQHVVVTREVTRMVVERTAEIALRKPALLDHRPHCAIENEDPFGK